MKKKLLEGLSKKQMRIAIKVLKSATGLSKFDIKSKEKLTPLFSEYSYSQIVKALND